jgi:hypothetical protein
MNEMEVSELEQLLEELEGSLECEVDLHGSRTVMAYNLRQNIIKIRKELEGLKSGV